MRQLTNTKKIIFSSYEKIIMTLIIISFLVITSENLKAGVSRLLYISSKSSGVTLFSLIIMFVFITSFFRKTYLIKMNVNVVLFIFSLYFFISYFGSVGVAEVSELIDVLILLLWVMCFRLGAYFSQFSHQKLYRFIFFFTVFVIFPITIQTLYYQTSIISRIVARLVEGNDWVFSTIVFFPFVLLLDKNKLLRIILILLFIIISFISLKRTILISSILLLFLYFILASDYKEKIKQLFSRYLLLVIPILIIIYNYLSKFLSKTLINRFESLSEDGGSGRDIIYEDIVNIFQNSTLNEMFFGHGYMSTMRYVGILAHNDSLQILIDFGLVGLTLYLIFIFYLLQVIVKRYRNREYYRTDYAVYVAAISSFIILTQSNCLIYSPFILSPIMFLIGILYFKLHNVTYVKG